MKKPDKWKALYALIENYVEARVNDSWKGGTTPADVPVIMAELSLAKVKLERHIETMRESE